MITLQEDHDINIILGFTASGLSWCGETILKLDLSDVIN